MFKRDGPIVVIIRRLQSLGSKLFHEKEAATRREKGGGVYLAVRINHLNPYRAYICTRVIGAQAVNDSYQGCGVRLDCYF
jgi:IMP cyclohydrolase